MDVRVSVQGADGAVLRGRTLNLSNGGLRLTLPRRLSPRATVRVTLHLRQRDISLMGAVTWSDEVRPAGTFGFRHGVEFRPAQQGSFALDIFTATVER